MQRVALSPILAALGCAGLAAGVTIGSAVAEAKITCKDGFQLSAGNWISTPYCNDEHLAEIGRRHGFKVTGAELRRDYGKKDDLCRSVGRSGLARHYCPLETPSGRGR